MEDRKILPAPEGYWYTDGVSIYGTHITLPVGATGDNFYLITEEEYEEIKKAQVVME